MSKVIFYHAGCPICISAENGLVYSLDPNKYKVESVHLGEQSGRVAEAEQAGVKSVPAIVMDGHTYHINYGASLEDLK